jgi:signal transduction histidine kinase
VWADREKLAQVLLNLLSNAVKFTEPGGRIALTAEAAPAAGDPAGAGDALAGEALAGEALAGEALAGEALAGDTLRLVVRDSGIGVPADKLDAIFDPFVQARQGLTRRHEGSGLGLAISREFARGMGGDLTVASAEGQGSAFTLTLRRARDARGDATDRRALAERREAERREAERREAERRDGERRDATHAAP